jgi:ankyrin repeat protein
VEVAKVLLELGADPNANSATRDQVLHIAVSQGNTELVSSLLAAGARPDYTTSLGETIWDAVATHSSNRAMLAALEPYCRQGSKP